MQGANLTPSFMKPPHPPSAIRRPPESSPLHALLVKSSAPLAWVAGFSLLASLLVLAPSVYMLEVYERVVNSRSLTTLAVLTAAVVVAFAVMEVLEWVRSELLQQLGHRMDEALSPLLFRLMTQARAVHSGFLIQQPASDWRVLREFLPSPFVLSCFELPASVVFLLLVWLINPWLAVTVVLSAGVQLVLAWATERRTRDFLAQANRFAAVAQQTADSLLRRVDVAQAMGMVPAARARWEQQQNEFLSAQAAASQAAGLSQAGTKFIQLTLGSALLGLSAFLLLGERLAGGAGMMVVASIIGGRVLMPVVQMITQWRMAVTAWQAWLRLDAALAAMPAPTAPMPLPAPAGALVVDQVAAAAPALPGQMPVPVLRGIHFRVQPGEVVAVVGPSGAGKSCLTRLLVGVWPCAAGSVRLDGVDVHAWNKDELGPHLGYLPQEIELFEGTLAENIARFREPDPMLMQQAAEDLGLTEFIRSLPLGFNTPIGPAGLVLSGGQRQRLALARAVYGRPSLVVLDEPNSNLDQAGDAALLRALSVLKAAGSMVVLTTQRTSVLAAADKILLLTGGAAVAFGPRDEVLAAMRNPR